MNFPDRIPVPLWSSAVPFSHGSAPEDIPTIQAFFPEPRRSNGKALVVLPGGAYCLLADKEGSEYAEWLARNGYTAFVCNYRLASKHYYHPVQLADAARAVRLVRAHAAGLGIRPDRIGIMGSSAGGHLAAMTATWHELGVREEGESAEKDLGRPDFSVLCYPVISCLQPDGSTVWTFRMLLGNDSRYPETRKELAEKLSMEKSADAQTPPAFLWHTWEDEGVPVENSLAYVARLRSFGIRCELHIYERGPHGMGLADGHPWTGECLRWLDYF